MPYKKILSRHISLYFSPTIQLSHEPPLLCILANFKFSSYTNIHERLYKYCRKPFINSVAFSPQAKYTDRVTATCRWS
jgi:hypothetical protein